MYKDKSIIAIIPARGGSKGLPRKNILPIEGKPLLSYTIEQAKGSGYLDTIVVSTDSEEIISIAKAAGAEALRRPDELAKDTSPTIDTIKHVLGTYAAKGRTFDIVLLLEPTSPLRKDDDIDNAIVLFVNNFKKADAVVSLGEIALESPFIAKIVKKGFVAPLINQDEGRSGKKKMKKITRRQDLPKAYFPYGVVYMAKTDALRKTGTFYQKKTMPYFIERWQNYEVDDLYDFIAIEAIIKHRNKEKEIRKATTGR